MFSTFAYVNIFYAVVYAVVYLRNATLSSFVGIAVVIVFNWLALLSYHQDDFRWKWYHYLASTATFYYTGYLIYGWYNVLMGVIEARFLTNENLFYLITTFIFCAGVVIHDICYFQRHLQTGKR